MTGTISFGGSRGTLLQPKMSTDKYKTFNVAQPLDTHFRKATCAEVECDAFVNGWTYKKADLITADLLYLVTHAGKRYKEATLDDSSELYLVFEPGQMCFQAASHRINLERPQFFTSGRGDRRSFNPRRAYQYADGDEWVEAFAEHQEILNRVIEQGM
jgi:hypothetical protein